MSSSRDFEHPHREDKRERRRMSKNQRSPPWSHLVPELLAMVFLRLPRRADRAFFTAVCRAWRTAVQQCRLPPSPAPWLVRPDGSATRFPCGSETFHLPDGVRYHNSCGEWLLLSRDDGSCFLMNPFSKATILLPKLCSYNTYSDPLETIHDRRLLSGMLQYHCNDISEVSVLSLVVCSKRLIAVIVSPKVLGRRSGTLALCRPGDVAWSIGTNERCNRLLDIVFFRGKLYAIGLNNGQQDLLAIETVDENGNNEPRVSQIERIFIGVPITSCCSYLVESRGRLLMICREINCRQETVYCWGGNGFILVSGSSRFEVFEADFGRMSWTEVRSLGDDLALFVGRGCSRAVCVSPYDLSGDSIFFVDDYTGTDYTSLVWKKTTTSCGVYDMKDRKVFSSWMSGDVPATWLFCEVHSMDTGESSMNAKGKGGQKAVGSNPRAKATNWPAVISEFLLDWYIEKKLAMPPKTVFKKLHHTACTSAVNSKYGTTYTVDQVQRHWRWHKDTWGLVAKHMNGSGGGWDDDSKMVTVSKSTLSELSPNDRGILSKPIQFFDKLQELFSGSTTDGSFMQDPSSAADPDQDDTERLDMMNDLDNYDKTDDAHGQDSDKLESNSDECQEVAALAAASSQISSSSVKSMKPNTRNFKRVGKYNTVPAAAQGSMASKSNTKPSPACVDDDMDVEIANTPSVSNYKSFQESWKVKASQV